MAPHQTSTTEKIPCNKCKADNAAERKRCRTCGAHLYVFCKTCKHKVARFLDACATCQSPLHSDSASEKGIVTKIKRRVPQFIFILIIILFLGYMFEMF
jgi:hypothetical protein